MTISSNIVKNLEKTIQETNQEKNEKDIIQKQLLELTKDLATFTPDFDVCKYCNQTLETEESKDKIKEIFKNMELKRDDLQIKLRKYDKDYDTIINKDKEQLKKSLEELSSFEKPINDSENRLRKFRDNITQNVSDLKNLKLNQAKINAEEINLSVKDDLIKSIQKYEVLIVTNKNLKKEVEIDLKNIKEQLLIYTYWSKGFKIIKHNMYLDVVKILEYYVNFVARKQLLEFDKIEIDAFKVNSTGVKVPFIDIRIKRNNNNLSLGNLSEGETKKFDYAIFIAFRYIYSHYKNNFFNFMILDEPLDSLDEQSKVSMEECILESSKDNQVFIIDHNSSTIQNSTVIKVSKDKYSTGEVQ